MLRAIRACAMGAMVLLAGCSQDTQGAPGGPRVYRGKDALGLLDTFVAEHQRVLDSLKGKTYRIEDTWDIDSEVSGHAKRMVFHSEREVVVANRSLFSKSSAKTDYAEIRNPHIMNNDYVSTYLYDENHVYSLTCTSVPVVANAISAQIEPRTEKLERGLLGLAQLAWWYIGFGDNSGSTLARWRDVLENNKLWSLEIEEEPALAPRQSPLYLLKFYGESHTEPAYVLTVDPEKGYLVVRVHQSAEAAGHPTEIEISVSRNETLPDRPWLPTGSLLTKYANPKPGETVGRVLETDVRRIRKFEWNITLPDDFFSIQRLGIPDGQRVAKKLNDAKIEALVYWKGELLPEDVAAQLMGPPEEQDKP